LALDAGEKAYLCLKRDLLNWPEVFAIEVKVIEKLETRYKVKVTNDFPLRGHTNEEATVVKGDVLKVSSKSLYSREQADVQPGARFESKPVCKNLMK
jgi:hypothetical protein